MEYYQDLPCEVSINSLLEAKVIRDVQEAPNHHFWNHTPPASSSTHFRMFLDNYMVV